jgi:hypothetical protein
MIVGSNETLKEVVPRCDTVNVGFDGTKKCSSLFHQSRRSSDAHRAFDCSSIRQSTVEWKDQRMFVLELEYDIDDSVEVHPADNYDAYHHATVLMVDTSLVEQSN